MNNKKNAQIINNKLRELEQNGGSGLTQNQLRAVVAIERLIARLETNPVLAEHLVFKGGFALLKLIENARSTHDLDASFYDIAVERLEPLVIEATYQDLEDGVFFYDIQSEPIKMTNDYPGVRYKMAFQITESRNSVKNVAKLSRIHFDMALGNFVPNSIIQNNMPSILDHVEPLIWRVYSPEQIFAEKLQAAVMRGMTNSRAKDIYDIVKLFDRINDGDILISTVKRIFHLRDTALPASFYDFFKNLNVLVLESAWRSVIVANKPEFLSIWEKFLDVTQKIDSIIQTDKP